MQLYTNPASPFCRKVDVVLRETGQRDDVTDISAVGHPTDSANMPTGVNPTGKIPVLVRPEGPALFDSRVICRYLNARANASLYPDGNWDVLTLEALADGLCDAAVLIVYEGRSRPEDKRHAPWIEGQWAKIARAIDALEAQWMAVLEGPLTIGQIATACALSYLDLRLPDRNWREGHPTLAEWHAKLCDRPAMQDTVPNV